MSDALSFAEIDAQRVDLLPARTVLSSFGYTGDGDNGGPAGDGGNNNEGGSAPGGNGGQGGDGGDAYAAVHDNVNNGFIQINIAVAEGGPGGHADGGVGGYGGDSGYGGIGGDGGDDD